MYVFIIDGLILGPFTVPEAKQISLQQGYKCLFDNNKTINISNEKQSTAG